MHYNSIFAKIAVVLTLLPLTVYPQFGNLLNSVKNTLGDVVNLGTQVTVAPYQSVINATQVVTNGASVSTIYQPYQQIGQTAGAAIPGAVQLANTPSATIYSEALRFSNNFGAPGAFIFDVGTFANQFYTNFGASTSYAVANILRGQNPFQVVSAPLAAAIRAARERHFAQSQPIPQHIKAALSGYFGSSTLNRARYCVGNVEITLPNFIGQGQKLNGSDHYAVVVDDIIIFNSQPPNYATSWWVHELTHVEQYEQMGIELFAFNYARDANGIESAADQRGSSFRYQNNESVSPATIASTQPDGNSTQSPYVIQVFFWSDPNPVYYLGDTTGRIFAVDPITGNRMQCAWSSPPRDGVAAWTFTTVNFAWAVTAAGGVFTFNPSPVQVGHVVRL